MTEKDKVPAFMSAVPAWERRYVGKFRLELVMRMNELLAEKGISQKDLAARAGWKPPFLSRVLAGDQNLTLKTIARFEDAIGGEVLVIPEPGEVGTIRTDATHNASMIHNWKGQVASAQTKQAITDLYATLRSAPDSAPAVVRDRGIESSARPTSSD